MAEHMVVTIAPEIAARVRNQDRFDAALARAAAFRHDLVASPMDWMAGGDGGLQCIYPAVERVALVPGEQSPATVARLGMKAAKALTAIHEAGLTHGAVVTEALAQTADGGVQLGRLGLFSALCDGGLSAKDAALALSDPVFVAPEVQKGQTPDERSDVFSLGASLYELLTGKPPYGGRTTSFVMAAVLIESGAERTSGAMAGPVVDALLRAIERAPDDRWPSAAAFAQALTFDASAFDTPVAKEQKGWISAIFRSWFPARRSRG